MRHCRLCVLCPIVVLILAVLALIKVASANAGQAPEANAPGSAVSFMEQIAPLLKENCLGCHDAKKRKGKLEMTSFEKLMKGGDSGEPVVPGKPEESLLWTLTSGTEDPHMPPKDGGGLMPKEKVALLERWIKEGAKFDGPSPQTDLLAELRRRWKPPVPPAEYPFPSIVRALAFTPDGKQLIVGGHHELLVWDFNEAKLLKRIRTRAERANAMLFLPDGKTLVVAGGRPGQEGDVRLYNLEGAKTPSPPAPLPQGGEGGMLDGVDPKGGVLLRELVQAEDEILCLALSPDGKKLAAGGSNDRTVRVWDLAADFKLDQTIENHADWVFSVAFAADNKHLFTASRDKTAKVWDLSTKESVQTFPDHQNAVYAVAVKPDGKVGVSGGEDNQLRFWNATPEGKQVRAAGGHGKAVWKLIWHPSKPAVVSCSADSTVRVFNPDNGQNVRTMSGHTDWIYALALSPDGNLVASGAWNGEVRVWKLDDGALVKAFNASPGVKTAAK